MNSVGIVAEYNPFHNGHLYQLKKAKEVTNSQIVIVIMSGNFLQRGEPAIVSKWTRTKMALRSGADLIIELPYAYAVQKAETFAHGAVSLLNAVNCKSICFGSESGDINEFHQAVDFLNHHQHTYDAYTRDFLKTGMSYPSALAAAFKKMDPSKNMLDLTKPNNILGYYYVSSIKKINPSISSHTIMRKHANYHDTQLPADTIASATSIRNSIFEEGKFEQIANFLPSESYEELMDYDNTFQQFHQWESYWPFLQYQILTKSIDELRAIYEMEEGLEHRVFKSAATSTNFLSFMKTVKTKRYTWTRLQRICVHILINAQKAMMKTLPIHPNYIRLLGMSQRGREYLSSIKKDLVIPLVSKVSAHKDDSLSLDHKAAHIYAQTLPEPERSLLYKMEFAQPPIIFEE